MPRLTGKRWVQQVRRDWIRSAEGWERWEPNILYSLAAVDSSLFRALELAPGQKVLDFGCGSGEPTLSVAPLVAPGRVTGLDLSPAMLQIARRRLKTRGLPNVRFVRADIGSARLRGKFDRVMARYGLMFVEDMSGTLENLRAALKPRGRIALAVWGPADRNPFFTIRAQAARPFMKQKPPDPETVPNPLRLGRPGLLPRLMRRAGFRDVKVKGVLAPFVYHDESEYIATNLGVPGPLMDLYESLSRVKQARLRQRLARGVRAYRDGVLIRIPGFAWIVSGRR